MVKATGQGDRRRPVPAPEVAGTDLVALGRGEHQSGRGKRAAVLLELGYDPAGECHGALAGVLVAPSTRPAPAIAITFRLMVTVRRRKSRSVHRSASSSPMRGPP